MKQTKNYQELSVELDQVLAKIQSPEVSVDELTSLYEDGLKLVNQLEEHLKNTENKIEKIKLAVTKEDK